MYKSIDILIFRWCNVEKHKRTSHSLLFVQRCHIQNMIQWSKIDEYTYMYLTALSGPWMTPTTVSRSVFFTHPTRPLADAVCWVYWLIPSWRIETIVKTYSKEIIRLVVLKLHACKELKVNAYDVPVLLKVIKSVPRALLVILISIRTQFVKIMSFPSLYIAWGTT